MDRYIILCYLFVLLLNAFFFVSFVSLWLILRFLCAFAPLREISARQFAGVFLAAASAPRKTRIKLPPRMA